MTTLHDRLLFWRAVIVFTILSGASSLFIIISVLRGLRKDFSARLVMYLSIADLCLSVICLCLCGYNLHNKYLVDSLACKIQPFITWYFMEVSILWLMIISIHSYKVVFYIQPFSLMQEMLISLFCWFVPLFTCILPYINGAGQSYGPRNDLWCSFADKTSQLINILIYYIPCLVIITFSYTSIIIEIARLRRFDTTDTGIVRMIKKLFMFVAAYFVVWTPLVLSYAYEYATGNYVSFGVEFIVDNLLHIQGIINFILYGINEDIIRSMKKSIVNIMV